MTPSGMQAADGDENAEDKTESDGATKDNNQHAENQNVSFRFILLTDGAICIQER